MTDSGVDAVAISASTSAQFVPISGQPLSRVSVRVDGAILQREKVLTMEIWIGGTHAHFQTGNADPATATAFAEQVVASLAQHNWIVLYAMLAPEAQASFKSEQQFASSLSAIDTLEATLSGSPTISSANGFSYYTQGISLKVKDSSGIRAYTTTLYLVYETGRWYFLGNDPPVPAP